MSETKTYVRDATGLVREIGVLTATIFILSNVIGGGWQYRVFQYSGPVPVKRADYLIPGIHPIIIAFILTGAAAIATVYLFAVMSTAMPRAGGGYVYISRTISPAVGFVTAWCEFLGIAISYGLIAVFVIELAAWFLPIAGFTGLDFLSESFFMTIGGIVFAVGFAALAYFGTSMVGKALHIMFWIPAAITVFIYAVLIMGFLDPSITAAGVEEVTGVTATDYINEAIRLGINDVETDYVSAVFTGVFGAYWAWIGYAAISFAAGEVKESNRSLPLSHFAAGFIILIVYVSISFLMSNAAAAGNVQGWTFFEAISFLDWGPTTGDVGSEFLSLAVMPNVAMMPAMGLDLGIISVLLTWLFALAGILWLANDLPPFITTSSRILFAMSFDRTLPEAFAKVDERWHSPTNAIIATTAVSILGVFSEASFFSATGLGIFLGGEDIPILNDIFGYGTGVAATNLLDAVFFTTACVAAILLPRRLKDVYERAPWKPKIFGYEGIVVMGWIALILNLYLDLITLGVLDIFVFIPGTDAIPFFPHLLPNLGVGFEALGGKAGGMLDFSGVADLSFTNFNWFAWIFVGAIVIGLVIYLVMKSYYSRRGVDFSTIYATIPPE
jgi:amino acid transporter